MELCPDDPTPVVADKDNPQSAGNQADSTSNDQQPDSPSEEDTTQVAEGPEAPTDTVETSPTFSDEEMALLQNTRQTYFAYNSAQVNPNEQDQAYYELIKKYLEANPSTTVLLTGHTDNTGTEAGNQALGLRRAESKKQFLVSLGIPAEKINTDSKGMTQPIADNATEAGRQKNRRVDIIVQQ